MGRIRKIRRLNMQQFWSYITHGTYSIGCTGGTVYVFREGAEIARFSGFKYTYYSCISHDCKYFAVKSAEGVIYLYSLETLSLLGKLRVTKKAEAMNRMMLFSPDGNYLVSINGSNERKSCICFYTLPDLKVKTKLYTDSPAVEPQFIEIGTAAGEYFVLCGEPNEDNIFTKWFISHFSDFKETARVYISETEYEFYMGYKEMENMGFTEKSKTWSSLRFFGYELSNIEEKHHSLAKIYKYYAG